MYILVIGTTTQYLKATDETAARAEAQIIVDGETSLDRRSYHAKSGWPVKAILRKITDLQEYEIFTPLSIPPP